MLKMQILKVDDIIQPSFSSNSTKVVSAFQPGKYYRVLSIETNKVVSILETNSEIQSYTTYKYIIDNFKIYRKADTALSHTPFLREGNILMHKISQKIYKIFNVSFGGIISILGPSEDVNNSLTLFSPNIESHFTAYNKLSYVDEPTKYTNTTKVSDNKNKSKFKLDEYIIVVKSIERDYCATINIGTVYQISNIHFNTICLKVSNRVRYTCPYYIHLDTDIVNDHCESLSGFVNTVSIIKQNNNILDAGCNILTVNNMAYDNDFFVIRATKNFTTDLFEDKVFTGEIMDIYGKDVMETVNGSTSVYSASIRRENPMFVYLTPKDLVHCVYLQAHERNNDLDIEEYLGTD